MCVDRDRKGVKPAGVTAPWLPAITKLTYGWRSVRPTMSEAIRNWINAHIAAAKTTTGTTHGWGIQAALALYKVTLGYRWAAAWSLFSSYVVAGRGTMVSIHYGTILGTPYSSSVGFTGRHRIYVNERRWNPTANRFEFLVDDPLAAHNASWQPQGPQWWPAWLLQKAMYAAMGNQTVEFSFTRDTEP
jgi:hypothetical protein